MREKEEQREMKKYNYTLLRVRFPDGYILQGKQDALAILLTSGVSQSWAHKPCISSLLCRTQQICLSTCLWRIDITKSRISPSTGMPAGD